jgi:hypothetical protein
MSKRDKRLDLYLEPDDYDFLGWMIHHYKCRNRSTAVRVCIKAMREWMRQGKTPDNPGSPENPDV